MAKPSLVVYEVNVSSFSLYLFNPKFVPIQISPFEFSPIHLMVLSDKLKLSFSLFLNTFIIPVSASTLISPLSTNVPSQKFLFESLYIALIFLLLIPISSNILTYHLSLKHLILKHYLYISILNHHKITFSLYYCIIHFPHHKSLFHQLFYLQHLSHYKYL